MKNQLRWQSGFSLFVFFYLIWILASSQGEKRGEGESVCPRRKRILFYFGALFLGPAAEGVMNREFVTNFYCFWSFFLPFSRSFYDLDFSTNGIRADMWPYVIPPCSTRIYHSLGCFCTQCTHLSNMANPACRPPASLQHISMLLIRITDAKTVTFRHFPLPLTRRMVCLYLHLLCSK